MEKEQQKNENILNPANILTFSRIIISFLTIYFIFADFNIFYIVVAFIIGMLTDLFDGQIARRFKITTEFGRQFDMIADRFLLIPVALATVIKFSIAGTLARIQTTQIFLILSREIITFPFLLMAVISGKSIPIPRARFIGKVTTFIQAGAFPMVLLSIFYKAFSFSLYFAILTGIIGLISGFYYIYDIKKMIAK